MKENLDGKNGLFANIKNGLYDLSVKMHGGMRKKSDGKKDGSRKSVNDLRRNRIKELGFLSTLFLWPTLCLIVNYIFVNVNNWMLAFQEYDVELNRFVFISGFDNFFAAYDSIFTDATAKGVNLMEIFGKSLLNYFYGFLITTPLQLLASFAIYKKVKGNKIFVVILYLPQIVASMVWVTLYRLIIVEAFPVLFGNGEIAGVFYDRTAAFPVLLLFGTWTQIGGALMIVTGTFARIPIECVEAAEIDGCSLWKEFWYITFPNYYPVFAIGIFTGVAGIFTGMPATFEFYGNGAPGHVWTFGYYFFNMTIGHDLQSNQAFYPIAAACGIMFTLIVLPIILFTKWLVQKGDKTEAM